jgi:esterase/lipase superfamily enzyme
VARYQQINRDLFLGDGGLGICVLFTWPSKANPAGYLPDRREAEQSGDDLADVLDYLYDYLVAVEARTARSPERACRAKTSIIAHSMGNYRVQKAAQRVWTRKNQPLLVSLINQLLMVAADVDNDLFKSGEQIDKSDGDALANLTYRITAFYTGLDQALGVSAGLKHFGKRRLGRSGLDRSAPLPDNVWDIDCTPNFETAEIGALNIHSGYFIVPSILDLMRKVLRGVDRDILARYSHLELGASVNRALQRSGLRIT